MDRYDSTILLCSSQDPKESCGRPRKHARSSRLVRDRLSLKVHELELEAPSCLANPCSIQVKGRFSWGLRSWIEHDRT